jgi:hypothetical protein
VAKSYPIMDVKCNECGDAVAIEIPYRNEFDRWTRASSNEPVAWVPKNFGGWALAPGNDGSDYCPKCVEKRGDCGGDPEG